MSKTIIINEQQKSLIKNFLNEGTIPYDISQIGEVVCTLEFDEDYYNDYLEENGLVDNQEVREQYIKEYCEYSVEFTDSETYHSMGGFCSLTYEDLYNEFGEKLANDVFVECMDGKEHRFEVGAYDNETVDLNNPDSINASAIKHLMHGEYYKDCRGFILTNGVVVYTEAEHNHCSQIPGVNGTFHFLKLGNIRVLNHSIDIANKPTNAQMRVLYEVLDAYYGEVLYLDLMNDKIGHTGKQYDSCNPDEVMQDINSYFKYGRI